MANESNPLMAFTDPDLLSSRHAPMPVLHATISGLITALGDRTELIDLVRAEADGLADHELPALKIALVTAHDAPEAPPERQQVLNRLLLACHEQTLADAPLRRTNQLYDRAEQRITGIFLHSLGRGSQSGK